MKNPEFERWSAKALHEPTTRTLWSWIINGVLVSPSQAIAKERLKAWAEENGIAVRFESTTTPAGPDYWVHTTRLR